MSTSTETPPRATTRWWVVALLFFLGWVFIYLPAFLSVYGILPDWYLYRDRPGVQRLLIGVSCVSSGLALASVTYG